MEEAKKMVNFPFKFKDKKKPIRERKCRGCKSMFEVEKDERVCPSCYTQAVFGKETRKRNRREQKNPNGEVRKAKKKRANKRKRKSRRK